MDDHTPVFSSKNEKVFLPSKKIRGSGDERWTAQSVGRSFSLRFPSPVGRNVNLVTKQCLSNADIGIDNNKRCATWLLLRPLCKWATREENDGLFLKDLQQCLPKVNISIRRPPYRVWNGYLRTLSRIRMKKKEKNCLPLLPRVRRVFRSSSSLVRTQWMIDEMKMSN